MNTKTLLDLVEQLAIIARRRHYGCEDYWYSCPKHEDGCGDESQGDECNCGAEKHNLLVEQLVGKIKEELTNVS